MVKLSVVMPVRNAGPYLNESIRSIIGQSFADFEFIIRDDASTDGSTDVLRDWAARDTRIKLIIGDKCLGPAGSSNFVVEQSQGELIARMDADDVSHPDRLQMQLNIFKNNPDAVLVGSMWEGIDRDGRVVRERDFSTLARPTVSAPFAHGSTMMRRHAFDLVGGYRAECDYWEDLDLYLRLARIGRILVAPQTLYFHRFSETSARLTSASDLVERALELGFLCREAVARGEEYETLLTRSDIAVLPRPRPTAYVALGSIPLWSGVRPHVLRTLLIRSRFRADMESALSFLWAVWADVSPRSLVAVLRRLARRRSKPFETQEFEQQVHEWDPWRLRGSRERTHEFEGRQLAESNAAP